MPIWEADFHQAGGVSLSEAAYQLAARSPDTRPIYPDLHRETFGLICEAISARRLPVYLLNQELRQFRLDADQFSDFDQVYAASRTCFDGETFLTADGQTTFGEPFVKWADLLVAFPSPGQSAIAAQVRKPLPAAREHELRTFLVGWAREQKVLGKPNNDEAAYAAAEEHFNAQNSAGASAKASSGSWLHWAARPPSKIGRKMNLPNLPN